MAVHGFQDCQHPVKPRRLTPVKLLTSLLKPLLVGLILLMSTQALITDDELVESLTPSNHDLFSSSEDDDDDEDDDDEDDDDEDDDLSLIHI